jgi:hypothetical protein
VLLRNTFVLRQSRGQYSRDHATHHQRRKTFWCGVPYCTIHPFYYAVVIVAGVVAATVADIIAAGQSCECPSLVFLS